MAKQQLSPYKKVLVQEDTAKFMAMFCGMATFVLAMGGIIKDTVPLSMTAFFAVCTAIFTVLWRQMKKKKIAMQKEGLAQDDPGTIKKKANVVAADKRGKKKNHQKSSKKK